jgi:hypothetical protein
MFQSPNKHVPKLAIYFLVMLSFQEVQAQFEPEELLIPIILDDESSEDHCPQTGVAEVQKNLGA